MALIDKLKNIANAVRTKTNKTGLLTLDDLATEIYKIPDFDMYINMEIEEITSNITDLKMYAFSYCTKLKYVYFPELIFISHCAFIGCTALKTVVIPKVIEIYSAAFSDCESLERIELKNVTCIQGGAFSGCKNLKMVIINSKKSIMFEKNIFDRTPISSGTGYIYVPDELVEQFKHYTNLSAYVNQIKPISELEE